MLDVDDDFERHVGPVRDALAELLEASEDLRLKWGSMPNAESRAMAELADPCLSAGLGRYSLARHETVRLRLTAPSSSSGDQVRWLWLSEPWGCASSPSRRRTTHAPSTA